MRMKILVVSLCMALAPTAALPVAAAQAAGGCASGENVFKNYSSGGSTVARLCYSGTRYTLRSVKYRGVSKTMFVKVCRLSNDGVHPIKSTCRTDTGKYKYYAGPVNFVGGCLWEHSVMWDGNHHLLVNDILVNCN